MNRFETISDFNRNIGINPPENPLFSITFGINNKPKSGDIEFSANFYIIGFKKLQSGSILYGKTKYDHDLGKMSFIKPRQIVSFKDVQLEEACFLVLIHEDFLAGTVLHNEIKKYTYFDYEVNEALHLTPNEEEIIWGLVQIMDKEHRNNTDDYSKTILISHLSTLLKYAQRFYKRQFLNRSEITGIVATKFNMLLASYFEEGKTNKSGLPTVNHLAKELNISPSYLSDLLKQETGKTALELIHLYLISEAKNLLKEGKMNIAEISFSLGFENANYFSRLFKRKVGITPNTFKNRNLN